MGWYLQQLLKLYCGRAIARAARNTTGAGPGGGGGGGEGGEGADVLVADSDVVWTRDVAFVHAAAPDAGGACRATYNYAFSREAHQLYYDTNARLLGAAGAPLADSAGRDISGVAHHMVLRGDVVAALEAAVAARHGAPLHAALFRARRVSRRTRAATRSRSTSSTSTSRGGASRPACACTPALLGQRARAARRRRVRRRTLHGARRRAADVGSRHGGREIVAAAPARRAAYRELREAAAVRLRPAPTPPTAARASGAAARGPASRAASTSGSSAGTARRDAALPAPARRLPPSLTLTLATAAPTTSSGLLTAGKSATRALATRTAAGLPLPDSDRGLTKGSDERDGRAAAKRAPRT